MFFHLNAKIILVLQYDLMIYTEIKLKNYEIMMIDIFNNNKIISAHAFSKKLYIILLYVTIFIERSEKHLKNHKEALPMLIFTNILFSQEILIHHMSHLTLCSLPL